MSLDEMSSAGSTVEIGGDSLLVDPRILRHIGIFMAAVRKERGSSMELVRDALELLGDNVPVASVVVQKAFEEARTWRRVTVGEAFEYIADTWEGRCLAIWVAVRDSDPKKRDDREMLIDISDQYENITRKDGIDAAEEWIVGIESAITRVSGDIDEMGNSTGSPPSTPEKVGQAMTAAT